MKSYFIFIPIIIVGGFPDLLTSQQYSVPNFNGPLPLGQSCRHVAVGYGNPAFSFTREGYFYELCHEELYQTCKDQPDGGRRCDCYLIAEPSGLCKAPKPTQAYGEHCSHLHICKDEFICNNRSHVTDVCRCPDNMPNVRPDGKGCEGHSYGEKCSYKIQDCKPTLECISSSICTCPAATPNLYEGRCFGKYYKDDCDATKKECAITLVCLEDKCECADPNAPKKVIWYDARKECDGQPYGEPCAVDDDCTTSLGCYAQKCGCSHTQKYENGNCVALAEFGDHCDPPANPACVNNLVCYNDVCGCPTETTYNSVERTCDINIGLPFNAPCGPTNRCNDQDQLECIDQSCKCSQDRVWNAGECKDESGLIECDPTLIPEDCSEPIFYNWVCDPVRRVCDCPEDTEWAKWAQGCKLRAGQECYHDRKPIHDLCVSQQCDGVTDETGQCACPDKLGATQIYSTEPGEGCFLNYYLQRCDPDAGNTDCRPPRTAESKHNYDRPGLICGNDNTCVCPGQLSYSNGYCLTANLLPPQVCDRRFGGTCKTGSSSISCLDVGLGLHVCGCVPKVIHLQAGAGNSVKAPLIWDNETLTCELKPVGDICGQGYECISGVCTVGRCVANTRGSATGTHDWAGAGRGVLVVLAMVMVTFN